MGSSSRSTCGPNVFGSSNGSGGSSGGGSSGGGSGAGGSGAGLLGLGSAATTCYIKNKVDGSWNQLT